MPDAALGEGDGAARHPYQLRRSGLKLKSGGRTRRAFSLLEVMIAIGIFFMSTFVILSLVSSSLQNARRLQRPIVDAAMLAAELSLTNKLVEVTDSGDFGEMYPGYNWTSEIIEVGSNKLFQVNYVVQKDGSREVMQTMSVLFYRPESPAGSLDGATTSRR